jgi:hypothetical protein
MDERFFSYDESPLLILDTTAGGSPATFEEPGRLDETIDVIRRTRAGAQCIKLGA